MGFPSSFAAILSTSLNASGADTMPPTPGFATPEKTSGEASGAKYNSRIS
jgi:hypothetical protein